MEKAPTFELLTRLDERAVEAYGAVVYAEVKRAGSKEPVTVAVDLPALGEKDRADLVKVALGTMPLPATVDAKSKDDFLVRLAEATKVQKSMLEKDVR